jgi:hypothetical protein
MKIARMLSRKRPSLSDFRGVEQQEVERFRRYLEVADPLADALAAALSEEPAGRGRRMLDTALDHGIEAVERPPQAMVDLFRQVDDVPPWVDWERIEQGGAVFLRSGALGIAALGLLALPLTYSSGIGNKPLVFTGHLLRRAPRRLAETARFAVATSRPGGLRRFAEGFKFTIKVRLMHAQVRRLLFRSGRWKPQWGMPINQAFLAGTNLAMSLGLVQGVRRFGFRISRGEAEALLHLWRYSGYVSGIEPHLLCSTEAEGHKLGIGIFAAAGAPDDDSRALVDALMTASYFPALELPWRAAAAYGLSRRLIGDELADALGYPKSLWSWALPAARPLIVAADLAQRGIPRSRGWVTRMGTNVWDNVINTILGGARVEFRAPERLDNIPAEGGQGDRQRTSTS